VLKTKTEVNNTVQCWGLGGRTKGRMLAEIKGIILAKVRLQVISKAWKL
jgi:hypothetical protein